MKLLFAVLALVIIVSATTTIYFTYYTATFYTTDVFQLENRHENAYLKHKNNTR